MRSSDDLTCRIERWTTTAAVAALLLLAAPNAVAAPAEGPPPPAGLTGKSWLVADAGSGEVLAAFNPHLRLPPASTLKMLFADTVLPKFDRTTVHRVTPDELAGLGPGSSLVGIKEDLDYRVEDLWHGVFLSSGNDAVHVLAHMNGGIDQTVRQMQERARALGAADTQVVTPDGYDEDGQLSSAYDLTLFAREGLRNADFRSYCATKDAQFPGAVDQATGRRGTFAIQNTDRLLGKYPGLIGVKNGFTSNAGSTFTGAAERGGRTLLVTVMHPAGYQQVYEEAAALLDWGFAAAGKVAPVGTLAAPTGATAAGTTPAVSAVPPTAARAGATAPLRAAAGATGTAEWTVLGAVAACAAIAAGWLTARRRRRLTATPEESGTPEPAGATAVGRSPRR